MAPDASENEPNSKRRRDRQDKGHSRHGDREGAAHSNSSRHKHREAEAWHHHSGGDDGKYYKGEGKDQDGDRRESRHRDDGPREKERHRHHHHHHHNLRSRSPAREEDDRTKRRDRARERGGDGRKRERERERSRERRSGHRHRRGRRDDEPAGGEREGHSRRRRGDRDEGSDDGGEERRKRRRRQSRSRSPRSRSKDGDGGDGDRDVRGRPRGEVMAPPTKRRDLRMGKGRRDDYHSGSEDGHGRERRPKIKERSPEPPPPPIRRGGPLPSQADSFAVVEAGGGEAEADPPKEKPSYAATGLLAAASNSVMRADGSGEAVALKYHEPPEARKPSPRDEWLLFVFKGGPGTGTGTDKDATAAPLDTVPLGTRSCWLVGRDAAVADLLAEHPSVSKQHAVFQFRHVEKRDEFGERRAKVKPYLIDLESANGTTLNGEAVPEGRYLEVRSGDLVRFGSSSREYVVMLAPKE